MCFYRLFSPNYKIIFTDFIETMDFSHTKNVLELKDFT